MRGEEKKREREGKEETQRGEKKYEESGRNEYGRKQEVKKYKIMRS